MWCSIRSGVLSGAPSRRPPRAVRLAWAVAWCAAIGAGCGPPTDELVSQGLDGEESPIVLRLSPGTNDGTRGRLLKLAVTNVGKTPVGWDSSFKAFLWWGVNYADDTGVAFEEPFAEGKSSPADDELTQRFIKVGPGQTVTRTFDLDEAIEFFYSATPLGPRGHGPPVWFEGRRKYLCDGHADVVVRVGYHLSEDDKKAFAGRFGKSSGALEMTDKAAESNAVVLKSH
jgi:hypothetical protein